MMNKVILFFSCFLGLAAYADLNISSTSVKSQGIIKSCGTYHLKGVIRCAVDSQKKSRKGCKLFIGDSGFEMIGKDVFLTDFKDRAVEVTGSIQTISNQSKIYLSSGIGLIEAESIAPGTSIELIKLEKCKK